MHNGQQQAFQQLVNINNFIQPFVPQYYPQPIKNSQIVNNNCNMNVIKPNQYRI